MPATLDQDTETFLRERGIERPNAATYRDFRNHLAVNPQLRPSYRGLPAGQIPPPDYNSVQELAEQSLGRSDGDNNGRAGTPSRSSPPWAPEPGTTSFAGTRDAPSTWSRGGQLGQPVAAQDNAAAAVSTPTRTIDPVTGDITDDASGAVVSYGQGQRDTTGVDAIDTAENSALLDELMRAGPTVDDVIRGDATSQMPITSAARIASMQDAIDQMLNPAPQLDPSVSALPTAPTQSTLPAYNPQLEQERASLEQTTIGDIVDYFDRDNPDGLAGVSMPSAQDIEDFIGETVGNTWQEITGDYGDTPEEVYQTLYGGRFNVQQQQQILAGMRRNDPEMFQQLLEYMEAQVQQ